MGEAPDSTRLAREVAKFTEAQHEPCRELLQKSSEALLRLAKMDRKLHLSLREDFEELQEMASRQRELAWWATVFLCLYRGTNFAHFVGLFQALIERNVDHAGLAGQACYHVLASTGKDESEVLRRLYACLDLDADRFAEVIRPFTMLADRDEWAEPFVELVLKPELVSYGYYEWVKLRPKSRTRRCRH